MQSPKSLRTVSLLLALLLTLASLAGCGAFKPKAAEGDALIGVAVEGPHADDVRAPLRKALTPVIYTPQEEQRFYLEYVGEDSLGPISRYQSVLLLGTLESDDAVSQRVRRMLSDEVIQGVRDGDYAMVRQRDVWVRGQTVIVVVQPTAGELVSWLRDNGDLLYRIFEEDRDERMKQRLYAVNEQEQLADSLQQAHGWRLRIMHDYALVASSRSPNYVRLKRLYPNRFATVAWRQGTIEDVTVDSLMAWRNRIGRTFADPIRTLRTDMKADTVMIGGIEAVKVIGLWETIGPLGGGPFVAYLLHDEGTLYLLDGMVYAPDRYKEEYIRQFEVIFSTFRP